MNNVKIGVIGIGSMGLSHAKKIFDGEVKNLELICVCDKDISRKTQINVPFYTDYKEMIDKEKLDAVLIATPHYSHCETAKYAFLQGLNVVLEKPAGVFTKEVEELNNVAKKSGKIFSMMFNQRKNPYHKKIRDIVQNGEIGKPMRLVWIITNWYRTQFYYDSGNWRATWAGEGGGVLINQCPHNLDLWQWIFGMPNKIRAFCGYGKHHNIEVEDDVTIYGEYDNGAVATFITTTGEFPGTNRLEITGDKGKIIFEDNILKLFELKENISDFTKKSKKMFDSIEYKEKTITIDEPDTAHMGILQNFTNAILFGEHLVANGLEGINSLTISNAAYLSDWLDKTIEIPFDLDIFYQELTKRVKKSKYKEES